MVTGAVLCIACGYHAKLGGQMATVLEEDAPRPIDPNPYASPSIPADASAVQPSGSGLYNDLTERGAKQAAAVVRDAESVGVVLLITLCCCSAVSPLILPWYGYRLHSWYALNSQFNELRFPNSFSNHGALAARFQDAAIRLWCGTVFGAVLFVLLIVSIIASIVTCNGP